MKAEEWVNIILSRDVADKVTYWEEVNPRISR